MAVRAVQAKPGDELVVVAWHVDGSHRHATILEVSGGEGAPPYVVRWGDTGGESLVYPTSDAFVRQSLG